MIANKNSKLLNIYFFTDISYNDLRNLKSSNEYNKPAIHIYIKMKYPVVAGFYSNTNEIFLKFSWILPQAKFIQGIDVHDGKKEFTKTYT